MTWLFSNNPFIVEMAKSYFESLWSSLAEKGDSQVAGSIRVSQR
jgi:hypothetical protein